MPVLPEVIVIQLTLSEAVQSHPLGEVTLILPVPPAAVNDLLVGLMEYAQGSPSWVTVWLFPATVIVAVLELVLELAETE